MKKYIGSSIKKTYVPLLIIPLLLISFKAQATTVVTVDSNDKVVSVSQPATVVQTVTTPAVVAPVVVTQEVTTGDYEGRIVGLDYAQYQLLVLDPNAVERKVSVKPETINNYRVGDIVLIHPTSEVIFVTLQENPRDFEGDIIRVDIPRNEIMVQDTNGRERRVEMKKGMIGTYKVDDYVRIHLMADLKEAKTIETIGDVRHFEGNVVNIDYPRGQLVVRDTHGNDTTVWARQGLVNTYHIGQHVRVYTLPNHNEAQLIQIVG